MITTCKSHPTEYSVLYALDFYLENEDYNTYSEDYYVDDAFDSEEEENYDDAFGKRKKREATSRLKNSRKKREAYETVEDTFFEKLSDDKSLASIHKIYNSFFPNHEIFRSKIE